MGFVQAKRRHSGKYLGSCTAYHRRLGCCLDIHPIKSVEPSAHTPPPIAKVFIDLLLRIQKETRGMVISTTGLSLLKTICLE